MAAQHPFLEPGSGATFNEHLKRRDGSMWRVGNVCFEGHRVEAQKVLVSVADEVIECNDSRLVCAENKTKATVTLMCACAVAARRTSPKESDRSEVNNSQKSRRGRTVRAYSCPFRGVWKLVPVIPKEAPWDIIPPHGDLLSPNWQRYHEQLVCVCKKKFDSSEERNDHWKTCKSREAWSMRQPNARFRVVCTELVTTHYEHAPYTKKMLKIPEDLLDDVAKILGPVPGAANRQAARNYLESEDPSLRINYKQLRNIESALRQHQDVTGPNAGKQTDHLAMLLGSLAINEDMGFIVLGENSDARPFLVVKFFDVQTVYFFPTSDLESVIRRDENSMESGDSPGASLGLRRSDNTSKLLHVQHPHCNDNYIRFCSEGHKYHVRGCSNTVSTTQLLKTYQKQVPLMTMANAKLEGCKAHKQAGQTCEYCHCGDYSAVLKVFEQKKQNGMEFHKAIARTLNGLLPGTRGFKHEIAAVRRMIEEKQWRVFRTEWPLYLFQRDRGDTRRGVHDNQQ